MVSCFVQAEVKLRRLRDPEFAPSVAIPNLRTSATGLALSMGVFSNARYQITGGIDRYLFDHAQHLIPYLTISSAFRALSTCFGQETRLHLQVIPFLYLIKFLHLWENILLPFYRSCLFRVSHLKSLMSGHWN